VATVTTKTADSLDQKRGLSHLGRASFCRPRMLISMVSVGNKPQDVNAA
jgi:PAS domain-containing protein